MFGLSSNWHVTNCAFCYDPVSRLVRSCRQCRTAFCRSCLPMDEDECMFCIQKRKLPGPGGSSGSTSQESKHDMDFSCTQCEMFSYYARPCSQCGRAVCEACRKSCRQCGTRICTNCIKSSLQTSTSLTSSVQAQPFQACSCGGQTLCRTCMDKSRCQNCRVVVCTQCRDMCRECGPGVLFCHTCASDPRKHAASVPCSVCGSVGGRVRRECITCLMCMKPLCAECCRWCLNSETCPKPFCEPCLRTRHVGVCSICDHPRSDCHSKCRRVECTARLCEECRIYCSECKAVYCRNCQHSKQCDTCGETYSKCVQEKQLRGFGSKCKVCLRTQHLHQVKIQCQFPDCRSRWMATLCCRHDEQNLFRMRAKIKQCRLCGSRNRYFCANHVHRCCACESNVCASLHTVSKDKDSKKDIYCSECAQAVFDHLDDVIRIRVLAKLSFGYILSNVKVH